MDVEKYLGQPYEKFNCWEIVREIYMQEKGIELPEDIYKASGDFLEVWFDNDSGDPMPSVRPYDGLLMRRLKPFAEHVALCVNETTFIHARRRMGTCLEPIARWRHKILQVCRHRKLQ